MFETLLALTALTLMLGTSVAFMRTRDVLHPMLFLGPLFFYSTVVDPWLVRDSLPLFFRQMADVEGVLVLQLVAMAALVGGALHDVFGARAAPRPGRVVRQQQGLREHERVMLQRAALLLATYAVAAYSYSIANVGGFTAAFSQAKGGGYAASGYITEGMNLSLAAVAMVALSRYRQGWTVQSFALLVAGLIPNLVQGTFGGRRGPLFLALAGGLTAWLIVQRRSPKLWVAWSSLAAALLSVAFIGSQRQSLYLGSEAAVSWENFRSSLTQADADEGNNFIYGAGFILATQQSGQYTWGRELAVNLLVRPIPRQLWPSKYEDAGATWVTNNYPGLGHLTEGDWLSAVGWLPLAGASAISLSDLFGEFGWGAVLALYLIGRGFSALSIRRVTRGGVWTLLYLEALILSIYLATQSFSAFYHRYLILSVPTIVAWYVIVGRKAQSTRTAPPRRVGVMPGRGTLAGSQPGPHLLG